VWKCLCTLYPSFWHLFVFLPFCVMKWGVSLEEYKWRIHVHDFWIIKNKKNRRREQQNQCRPLQIGSNFFKRKPLLKKRILLKKAYSEKENVKSDLSVTIINQKGKLIWAERNKEKEKKKSLFVSCGGCLIKPATTF